MTVRIGWMGLGRMGEVMAKCLIKAGREVSVWNRTVSKRPSHWRSTAPRSYCFLGEGREED